MTDTPQTGQLLLLAVSATLFVASAAASTLRRRGGVALSIGGIVIGVAVLTWHSVDRRSFWPLEDNFDALIWLALLLAGFTVYVQARRPIGGLDRVALPVVVLLMALAGWLGTVTPHEYDVKSVWAWTHRVTSYLGAAAFAIAGVAGGMYLLSRRRLKSKRLDDLADGASLERLEHVTYSAVTLGFALLTIGAVTGVVGIYESNGHTALGRAWFTSPKVLLTVAVWVVYALVLHAPLNPSFRGKRTAVLSVIGLVLMIGTLVAVQVVPTGR